MAPQRRKISTSRLQSGSNNSSNLGGNSGNLDYDAAFRRFLRQRPHEAARIVEELKSGRNEELIKARNRLLTMADEAAIQNAIKYDLTMERIEKEYKARRRRAIANATAKKLTLKDSMLKEIDNEIARVEAEYQASEISKTSTSVQIDTNKKTLRGRGGGVLVEPPTYFNSMPKQVVPSTTPNITYLLSEDKIADDLKCFAAMNNESPPKPSTVRDRVDVTVTKQRLSYGGRQFKVGDEISVENAEYGKIEDAKIESLQEAMVVIRGTASWDTRQVFASPSDLCDGRVRIFKKAK
ncbi:hypothetical protein WR25_23407 [Diploscapter pachys]|uniref:Uncharacterized protein n=1 Tax=Diploscapter pachys TaxID=2018661 RepID=A0A2A2JM52_9BILA|nr:hypothetical protein WR25_23407 [Diploscapter pachys]